MLGVNVGLGKLIKNIGMFNYIGIFQGMLAFDFFCYKCKLYEPGL